MKTSVLVVTVVSTLLSLSIFSCSRAQQEDANLTLAVFITLDASESISDSGRPFVLAVDLALELINNDSSLLPGYKLGYENITDSEVYFKLQPARYNSLLAYYHQLWFISS